MKNKISLVLTYHNEEKNIYKTLKNVFSQTLMPDELILVNSGSTDKSNKKVDNFIKTQKKIKIYNFSLNTNLPSTSKNMGIQVSNNQLIAFMDFGLDFNKDWLKTQFNELKKNKLDAVIGSVKLKGNTQFDQASVINTYGNKNVSPCIPGSLIKKKIFSKLGFFEKSRSLYDVLWKEKLFNSRFKNKINKKYQLTYYGINYSKDPKNLFYKSYLYYGDKILMKDPRTILYLSIPIITFFLFIFKIEYLAYLFFTYIIIRSVHVIYKSDINSFLNLRFILLLVFTSLTIDIGRLFGASKAFLLRIGVNSIITFLLLIYFLVFNTPIVSIMASNLIASEAIYEDRNYDAIVVFSGDGTTSYTNETYRKRALDAVEYAKKFDVKEIILSSGKDHTVSEVQLMRYYLLDQNISDKIYVFDQFPSSTFNNVILVGNKLNELNYKDVIFITAPYHYKRSLMMWEKNFPKINIYAAKNLNFQFNKYKWMQNVEEIKITIYEYMSIFYNRIKGQL